MNDDDNDRIREPLRQVLTLARRKRLTWSQKKSKSDEIQERDEDEDNDDKEACCGTRLLCDNEADEEDICSKRSVMGIHSRRKHND